MGEALCGLHLHIDGASGAAGDMMLGALLDLGVPREVIEDAFERVGLGRERLEVARVMKHGIAAVNVTIGLQGGAAALGGEAASARAGDHARGDHAHGDHARGDHAHGDHARGDHARGDHARGDHAHGDHAHGDHAHGDHAHGDHAHGDHAHGDHAHDHGPVVGHVHGVHGGHAHHPYRGIVDRVRAAGLAPAALARALDIFERIARAEARLHGTTVEEVAFHEVGAIDSIADVVGAAAGLAYLAPAQVSASPVAMGHGQVRTSHGILPVPSPAALEILREAGGLVSSGGIARELCTPTGAAILAHAVTSWAPMPPVQPVAVGHGAGDADLPDRPNVLRLVLGRPVAGAAAEESIYRVEANVDDMSPEVCEHASERLVAAGAVDVWWAPITMKKSRPALLLQALAPAAALDAVVRAVVVETTSIGVRFDRVARRVLERRHAEVETRFGRVRVKLALLDGGVVNAAPEYEDCRAAARAHGAPLKEVFAAAVAAWDRARE